MGNRSSKKSAKGKKGQPPLNRGSTAFNSALDFVMDSENEGRAISQRNYDEQEVLKLKKELLEDPQLFVLNNLLMSIMFFENYEREKQRFMHSSQPALEKELNPTLLRDETIECTIPDVVFESVNKNVRFRRIHGPNKSKTEPLAPRRFYVVNDNIEVLESNHTPHYSAIDKPSYQVVVEDGNISGFVKLKCAPIQLRNIKANLEVKPPEPRPGPSSQENPDEIYDYTTISQINTPKPLSVTTYERRDTLPKSCFLVKQVKKYDDHNDDDDDEEYNEKYYADKEKQDLFDDIAYISSNGFMEYFESAVFPNSLGLALGFDREQIKLARAIPGKIFCSLEDVDEDFPIFPCEIVPSIAIQWPVNLTFEFHSRSERPTMWDKFQEEYRWPKDSMVKDISGLSCVLVPKGYTPKRGTNQDTEIEWEVGFPKAQRYLDTHMSHTQVRAFLFILTLYKSYIEPVNKKYDGLLIDHIRTHMYWECESNPRDWPEHRLGTKVIVLIKSFMEKLSKGELPDFFIKKKNMFLNVPNKHLTHAQKVFHNVLENPAIYFIGALRQLKYTSHRFYPSIDFKRLYKLLTISNALQLINPRIRGDLPPNFKPKNRRPMVKGDVNYRKEIKWQIQREQTHRKKVLQKIQEEKEKEDNLKVERRGSADSINYEWQCEKNFDAAKIRELVLFFIRHFLEMARKSRQFRTQRQALFFLKQATYLCKILQDFGGLESDAREYMKIINGEEDTSKKISISEQYEFPPSTPKRNSAQFNWDITQQVKGNNINLSNLHMAYNNTSTPQTFSKLKKTPSNLKTKSSMLKSTVENARRSVVEFSDDIQMH